jgi:hypothetical protein
VQIVVLVAEQEADRLLGHPGAGGAARDSAVARLARDAGVTLAPQHPGASDPRLARWLGAELADRAAADRLVAALLALPDVEAAYIKPGAEPPVPPSASG